MIFSLTAAVFFIGLNARPATGVTEEPVSEAPVQESEEPCISIDLSEAAEAQVDTYSYEFLADLSEFEEYMNPADRDGYLQLINYENRLDASYKPDDLIEIPTRSDRETQRMRKTPAMALKLC